MYTITLPMIDGLQLVFQFLYWIGIIKSIVWILNNTIFAPFK